jgi:uncharacterized protein (DUF58 family)
MRFSSVRAALADRARRWARRRQGADTLPFALDRRRIYILPTPFGLLFALTVFVMLLASMNYNNSLGLALTFLLTGVGLVAMHHCHRNLSGIVISGVQTGEAFAGDRLALTIGCENPTAVARHDLQFECNDEEGRLHALEARGRGLTTLQLPTATRGVLRPERLLLSTHFPFGLFRAWSWFYLPVEAIVYPRPAGQQRPPLSSGPDHAGLDLKQRGDEDFRGFRSYHPGDSPRHIAWKALARGAPLLVKEHAGASGAPIVFDLEQVEARDLEGRLSQVTRWIVDAEHQARTFGLRLPGARFAPATGALQRRRCLTALALFDTDLNRATP